MSGGSTARQRYGSRCAAAGSNGSEAQPADSAQQNGNGTWEQQHPGGSIDIDAACICDNEECPFPTHDAFSPQRKQDRLRNQVRLNVGVEKGYTCSKAGSRRTCE